MTGEFLCFASLSFLVFENQAHMDGADSDLCSDNCFAGPENDFLFFFPSPSQSHTSAALQVKKSGSESFQTECAQIMKHDLSRLS